VSELTRRRYAEERMGQVRWTSSTHDRLVDEVAAELTIPSGAAHELIWLAEALTERHLRTWTALVAGRIDYRRAKVMAEALNGLNDELADRIESKVIGGVWKQTVTRLRARLKRAVRSADPAAADKKKKAAQRERRLESWENASGTGDLVGRDLAPEDVEAIMNRLTCVSKAMRADGDQRSLDAIRADLFRDLLRGLPLPEAAQRLRGGEEATQAGSPGGSGFAGGPGLAGDPGSEGGLPTEEAGTRSVRDTDILAAVERQIAEALAGAAGERLRRLVTEARAAGRMDGIALLIAESVEAMEKALEPLRDQWRKATGQHAHDGYRPPAAMRRLVLRRHETCVFPTCHRKSAACDLDHTRLYDPGRPDGGETRSDNLAPLCRRHHRTKQHRRWRLVQIFPGLLAWVTPAGRWHLVLPSPPE
ncbi:HNH endonuclease signature motif containing protein, partial [Actinomadura sp. HBU206391]|uniref:HNH endonuclease signature motif containing protein n=1 Tax=Actinomadura sp. HBU206391 TaxID=2731692 RepID=UPI00164F118F